MGVYLVGGCPIALGPKLLRAEIAAEIAALILPGG